MSVMRELAIEFLAILREQGAFPPSGGGGIKQRLLTLDEAAQYLGRTKAGVRALIAAGTLTATCLDRRVFLDVKDLDRAIDDAKGT